MIWQFCVSDCDSVCFVAVVLLASIQFDTHTHTHEKGILSELTAMLKLNVLENIVTGDET
jgi:hypothetical protein